MVDYKKKYQKIVDELIERSFPELKGRVPKVFELRSFNLHGVYLPIVNLVGVGELCRKFSIDEIEGILAHELCHAEFCKRYGFLKSFFLFFVYWFSSSMRADEEDKVERLAIEKGYARQLTLSSARLEKMYPDSKDKTFMSVKRIKSYAKRIGKW